MHLYGYLGFNPYLKNWNVQGWGPDLFFSFLFLSSVNDSDVRPGQAPLYKDQWIFLPSFS